MEVVNYLLFVSLYHTILMFSMATPDGFRPLLVSPDNPDFGEKCGILIYYPLQAQMLPQVTLGALAAGIEHRGQQGSGMVLRTNSTTHIETSPTKLGQFASFNTAIEGREVSWAMLHARYGTNGSFDSGNLQPCHAVTQEGDDVSVVHNGEFVQTEILPKVDGTPIGASDTYLFTQYLAGLPGSPDEKVLAALDTVNGAYSMGISIGDNLYVARDPQGIRPLFYGKRGEGENEAIIFASETIAFDRAGIAVIGEVPPGTILKLTPKGPQIIRQGEKTQGNFCDFELAYFENPQSRVPYSDDPLATTHPERWQKLEAFRERCGEALASEVDIPDADFVIGIPNSGVAVGVGFARAKGLPFIHAVTKISSEFGRLFMNDENMADIQAKVLKKLLFNSDPELWRDKVVVVADDSLVRGNVSKQIAELLRSFGVRAVHFVLGFPPVGHPCHLGVSMRQESELAAFRNNSDPTAIAQEIGADSVNYPSNRAFIQARLQGPIYMPDDPEDIFLINGGCGGCVTGRYPVEKDGTVHRPIRRLQ